MSALPSPVSAQASAVADCSTRGRSHPELPLNPYTRILVRLSASGSAGIILRHVATGLVFASLFASPAPASEPHLFPAGQSALTEVSPGVLNIGGATLDSRRRKVTVSGRVNMDRGAIELLACSSGGKTHESILVLDVEPHHLQVALLLLGLKATEAPLEVQGDVRAPRGDPVTISVAWNDSKKYRQLRRAEDLVLDRSTGGVMPRTNWVFVGSRFVDGVFGAQVERSLVTVYRDPLTIIDNPLPGGSDDTAYLANASVVPPVGTVVQVSFQIPKSSTNQNPRELETLK